MHGVDDDGSLDHADLDETAGLVGADEHGDAVVELEPIDRMADGMADLLIVDAVLVGAGPDLRAPVTLG